jgi:hypothetical protein
MRSNGSAELSISAFLAYSYHFIVPAIFDWPPASHTSPPRIFLRFTIPAVSEPRNTITSSVALASIASSKQKGQLHNRATLFENTELKYQKSDD